jgi:hypothetical protein
MMPGYPAGRNWMRPREIPHRTSAVEGGNFNIHMTIQRDWSVQLLLPELLFFWDM